MYNIEHLKAQCLPGPPSVNQEAGEIVKVIINETEEIRDLTITDSSTGLCYIGDFIGNADGFAGQFFKMEEHEANGAEYSCSKETFEWWDAVIDAHQKVEDRIFDLKTEYGAEAVEAAIEGVAQGDLDSDPDRLIHALEEAFSA